MCYLAEVPTKVLYNHFITKWLIRIQHNHGNKLDQLNYYPFYSLYFNTIFFLNNLYVLGIAIKPIISNQEKKKKVISSFLNYWSSFIKRNFKIIYFHKLTLVYIKFIHIKLYGK